MKACLCARGKDLNAQLQVENSIFPKFGRSRGSEKLTSFAKKNLQHSTNVNNNNISTNVGGAKDSEAVVIATTERDKKNINFSSIGNVCVVKTTTSATVGNVTTSNVVACNVSAANNENNKEINGCETTATLTTNNHQRGQRTQILHTDL